MYDGDVCNAVIAILLLCLKDKAMSAAGAFSTGKFVTQDGNLHSI